MNRQMVTIFLYETFGPYCRPQQPDFKPLEYGLEQCLGVIYISYTHPDKITAF